MRDPMSTDDIASGRRDGRATEAKAALIMTAFILTEGAWILSLIHI